MNLYDEIDERTLAHKQAFLWRVNMNDHELLGLLLNRNWRRWGLTTEQVLSPDSQKILPLREAAKLENIDVRKDSHYEEIVRLSQD